MKILDEIVKAATAVVESTYKSRYLDSGCYIFSIADCSKSENSDHVVFIVSETVETYCPGRDEDFSIICLVSPDLTHRKLVHAKNMDSSSCGRGWYTPRNVYKEIKSVSIEGGNFHIVVLSADGSEITFKSSIPKYPTY